MQPHVHIIQESLDQLLLEGIITEAFHMLQIRSDTCNKTETLKPIRKPLKLKLKLNRVKKQEFVINTDSRSDVPQYDNIVVTFRV